MPKGEKSLAAIVGAFRRRRMAVAGDWMLDRYVFGVASRISPEAPVPVVEYSHAEEVPGGAGNVAANLAALGAGVAAFGVAGGDEFAARLRTSLRALGIADKGILSDAARKTTVKTRIIAGHQQVVRVDRESRQAVSGALEEKLIRGIIAALRRSEALVLSDYDKGGVSDELAGRALSACRKLGLPAFVKPKWSIKPKYEGATAVVLNAKEAGFLVTRALEDDASVEAAGRALLEHFGCPCVVITRGARGMSVFEHGGARPQHIAATNRDRPTRRLQESSGREVFDVTGAGDTALAVFALGVTSGASFGDAARLANCAAGVAVAKLGTATVAREELLAALRSA